MGDVGDGPKYLRYQGEKRIQAEFRHVQKEIAGGRLPQVSELEMVGDQLHTWRFQVDEFDKDVAAGRQLNEDLRTWRARGGLGKVIFEARFPQDYPTQPFKLRLVKPRMEMYTGHITAGGSICIEALTLSGTPGSWQSTFCVETILVLVLANMLHADQVFIQTATGPGGMAGPARVDITHADREYSVHEADAAFARMVANHKIVGWGSQLPAAAPAPVAPVATAAPVMLQSVATAPQAILPSVATAPLSAAGPSAQQALQPSQQLHADAGPGPSRSAPAGTAACGREAGMSKGRKEGQDAGKDAAARQQLVDLLDEDVVMMLEHEGVDLQEKLNELLGINCDPAPSHKSSHEIISLVSSDDEDGAGPGPSTAAAIASKLQQASQAKGDVGPPSVEMFSVHAEGSEDGEDYMGSEMGSQSDMMDEDEDIDDGEGTQGDALYDLVQETWQYAMERGYQVEVTIETGAVSYTFHDVPNAELFNLKGKALQVVLNMPGMLHARVLQHQDTPGDSGTAMPKVGIRVTGEANDRVMYWPDLRAAQPGEGPCAQSSMHHIKALLSVITGDMERTWPGLSEEAQRAKAVACLSNRRDAADSGLFAVQGDLLQVDAKAEAEQLLRQSHTFTTTQPASAGRRNYLLSFLELVRNSLAHVCARCVVCHCTHGGRAVPPLPQPCCKQLCRYQYAQTKQYAELLPHLHTRPVAVELLVVLAQHACSSSRKDVVFDPAPVDYMDDRRQPMYSKIQEALHALPPVRDMSSCKTEAELMRLLKREKPTAAELAMKKQEEQTKKENEKRVAAAVAANAAAAASMAIGAAPGIAKVMGARVNKGERLWYNWTSDNHDPFKATAGKDSGAGPSRNNEEGEKNEEDEEAALIKAAEQKQGPQLYRLLWWVLANCPELPVEMGEQEAAALKFQLPRASQFNMEPNMQVLKLYSPSAQPLYQQLAAAHGTTFVFHGSGADRWYSILKHGLRSMSNTVMQLNGAAYGSGIYVSDRFSVSLQYAAGARTAGFAAAPGARAAAAAAAGAAGGAAAGAAAGGNGGNAAASTAAAAAVAAVAAASSKKKEKDPCDDVVLAARWQPNKCASLPRVLGLCSVVGDPQAWATRVSSTGIGVVRSHEYMTIDYLIVQ